jgi:hypothetical protein
MIHPPVSQSSRMRRAAGGQTSTTVTMPPTVRMNTTHLFTHMHRYVNIAPQMRPLPSISRRVRCGAAGFNRVTTSAYNEMDTRVMMHILPGSPPLLSSLSTPEGLRMAGHVSYAMLFVALSILMTQCNAERNNAVPKKTSSEPTRSDISPARSTTEHADT